MTRRFRSIPGKRFHDHNKVHERWAAAKNNWRDNRSKNEPEPLHQKQLKPGHPTPGESSKVAVHDVLSRRVDEMTEFFDGVSSSEVPLQFRCDFDRRVTAAPKS
ncbi:MAG: hypothetical protein ONB46_02070 [candidate division KSB1 bacterium]|nr:hypothetical protein [candidate division KSB1 bacterium]MDZ7364455.1 hypothetical protein [candidate division KSB1 bacterium]MDZ7402827.1 hypothetical protein [candidate division KSB1 bacterium]